MRPYRCRFCALRIVRICELSDPYVSGLLLGRRRKPAYTEKALVLSAHESHVAETVPHFYACNIHRDLRVCHADDAVASTHTVTHACASARAPGECECPCCAVASLRKENERSRRGSSDGIEPDRSQSDQNQSSRNQPGGPFCAWQSCKSQAYQGREAEACARRACNESRCQNA